MEELSLVTGGAGHLGTAVVKRLVESKKRVRLLLLETEKNIPEGNMEICRGDICNPESLIPFFENSEKRELIVIHCAGIVSISTRHTEELYRINVTGTENILKQCVQNHVKQMVYVSSVHAIPEKPKGQIMEELDAFNPDNVTGHYAKSKAIATAAVLEAVKVHGLKACVVHPSGIIGPYDRGQGYTTALVSDYCNGRLMAGVQGGYDFVDVRDVAEGILSVCQSGRPGEGYILSNRYFAVEEILEILHQLTGRKSIKCKIPSWFLRDTASLCEYYYQWKGTPPLFTAYSIYTLTSNGLFSHEKADRELSYTTRIMEETLRDTLAWLREEGRIPMMNPEK